ncbi:MAG: dihydrofolate reductase [Clostridium sp.]
MKAIVAVDLNWGIGKGRDLLQFIPEDMKFFKEQTLGNVVIMGRETFESLPGKNPLVDRKNIVLSRDLTFEDDRLTICRSIEEALEEVKDLNSDKVFIIGGEKIYKQFLPYCNELFITKIQKEYDADKYFPNVDSEDMFTMVEKSDIKDHKGLEFYFTKYVKK